MGIVEGRDLEIKKLGDNAAREGKVLITDSMESGR